MLISLEFSMILDFWDDFMNSLQREILTKECLLLSYWQHQVGDYLGCFSLVMSLFSVTNVG